MWHTNSGIFSTEVSSYMFSNYQTILNFLNLFPHLQNSNTNSACLAINVNGYILKNLVEQNFVLSCLNTPSFHCVLHTDVNLETARSKQGLRLRRVPLHFSLMSCWDTLLFLFFPSGLVVLWGCFLKCPFGHVIEKASHFAYDWQF